MFNGFPMSDLQVASILDSQHKRISIWAGAVRSGKTVACIFAFMAALTTASNSGLIIIAGRTLQTIERNIIAPMQDTNLMGPLAKQVIHTRGASTATILGRTVHLIGAADARAEGKLRGLSASLAMVDEATLIPEEFWNQLLARLSVTGARCMATTNPASPAHWLKKKFIDRRAELDINAWHFEMDDNPSLDPEYVAALKREYTGLWYKRFIQGLWVAAEGAVYPMWDEDRHMIPFASMPPIAQVLGIATDFGTSHATSAMMLGLTRPTGTHSARLILMDEWRYDPRDHSGINMAPSDQAKAYVKWASESHTPNQGFIVPDYHIVDPAAATFSSELRNNHQLYPQLAHNAVLPGISTISRLLTNDQLLVTDRCVGWRKEAPEYRWDPKATAEGRDEVIKLDDDSVDAARYVTYTTRSSWQYDLDDAA